MNTVRIIVAVLLIAAGIAGLVVRDVSYTKESTQAKLGTLELTVKEKKTIEIPVWASIGVVVAGIVLLLIPRK
jgi:Flp pilus assembly protein CpaB